MGSELEEEDGGGEEGEEEEETEDDRELRDGDRFDEDRYCS